MRISFRAGGAASSCSTSFTSWGFFSAGISLSIMAMNSMPPKKAATVAQLPGRCPSWAVRADWALAKISIMETYTMTPAEKPKLTDKPAVGPLGQQGDQAADAGAQPGQKGQKECVKNRIHVALAPIYPLLWLAPYWRDQHTN